MKCSVGVAIVAMVVLLCSALTLVTAAGAAYMFLGPMSGQLFDPAQLPPGADVRTMRAFGIGGALALTTFGSLGLATGIGLIRLWRWARYSTIVFGVVVVFFSLVTAVTTMYLPIPPPTGGASELPAGFRMVLAGFYGVFALASAGVVFYLTRAKTAAQFAAGTPAAPPLRPLSVTIIAWIMIVSGVMMLPSMVMMHPPAVFLGVVLTGFAAKLFYVGYAVAYVVIGVGLIRRTAEALMPAIVLHAIAVPNALAMLLPGTWARYHDALAATSPMLANQPVRPWAQYSSVAAGLIYAGIVLYFLLAARFRLTVTSDEDGSYQA